MFSFTNNLHLAPHVTPTVRKFGTLPVASNVMFFFALQATLIRPKRHHYSGHVDVNLT